MHFDDTGKVSLDHIYTRPDPRAYFATLSELDYHIPQLAKPYFTKLCAEYRAANDTGPLIVLDLGCSYGINAALLKCDTTMDALYEHYDLPGELTTDELLARDHEFVRKHEGWKDTRFIGLDVSRNALSYALLAGFIDDAVCADLETGELTERQRLQLAGTDLVISTGCLGYVTEKTLSRVVEAAGERRPWLAHFVLRMFPFDPVAESLAGFGYHTVRVEGLFRQRRFASRQEQEQVLDTLSAAGVDPRGLEDEGWFYAQLYLSRPAGSPEVLVQPPEAGMRRP